MSESVPEQNLSVFTWFFTTWFSAFEDSSAEKKEAEVSAVQRF